MTPRLRAWLLVLSILVLCGVVLGGAYIYRSRNLAPAAMLKRLPRNDSVILYIDVAALRNMGVVDKLFDNASVRQDPEYQSFIQKIDFDFRHDLDTVMAAFAPTGKYMLLRGRFDWRALKDYVISQDGHCNNAVCKMVGSAPDRRISYFPLQRDMMALAVSPDEAASDRMNAVDQRPDAELPNAPVWLMIPGSVLRSGQSFGTGTRIFADKLERAQSAILWIATKGDKLVAKMDVRCNSVADAVQAASDLTKATNLARRVIESENQTPNPADLSGLLTSGKFHNEGTKVLGEWPIEQVFLENMLR